MPARPPCPTSALCLALGAALSLVGCATTAASQSPRVAVLEFRGSHSAKAQAAVADVVGEHYELVSHGRYVRAARELGAKRTRVRHVRKVAAKLDLAAVVQGRVVRRGRGRYSLKLRIRDGATGKTIERQTIPLSRHRITRRKLGRLERKLVAAIDELEARHEADETHEADVPDERARPSARRKRVKRRHRGKAKHARARSKARDRRERASKRRAAKRKRPQRSKRARLAKRETLRTKRRKKAKRKVLDEDSVAVAEAEADVDVDVDDDPGYKIVDRYDSNGNIIDDEVPEVLRHSR